MFKGYGHAYREGFVESGYGKNAQPNPYIWLSPRWWGFWEGKRAGNVANAANKR